MKKGGQQKKQKMKSLLHKQAPILRLLENILHWESSRDLFQNVAFLEDDNMQQTWLATRVSTMKGISSIEWKTLFEGSTRGDSRFLDEKCKYDYFKGSERPKPPFWFRPDTKTETVIGRYFWPIP